MKKFTTVLLTAIILLTTACGTAQETETTETAETTPAETTEHIETTILETAETLLDKVNAYLADENNKKYNPDVMSKYFYGTWNGGYEGYEQLIFSDYEPCSMFSSVTHPTSAFVVGNIAYTSGIDGGAPYAMTVDTAKPDEMTFYPYGIPDNETETLNPASYTYTKTAEYYADTTNPLSALGILELAHTHGFDVPLIDTVNYTDENGDEWVRETGYVIAPAYDIYVVSEDENSLSFSTKMAMKNEIIDYDTMIHTRDVTYTIAKTDGTWIQTIDTVSDINTAD